MQFPNARCPAFVLKIFSSVKQLVCIMVFLCWSWLCKEAPAMWYLSGLASEWFNVSDRFIVILIPSWCSRSRIEVHMCIDQSRPRVQDREAPLQIAKAFRVQTSITQFCAPCIGLSQVSRNRSRSQKEVSGDWRHALTSDLPRSRPKKTKIYFGMDGPWMMNSCFKRQWMQSVHYGGTVK